MLPLGSHPQGNAASAPQSYRTDIDGLRALAVLAVVLFHAHVPFLQGGFVGVDVFFVISGYLIGAHIYHDLAAGTFQTSRFYARRAKRILPALFAVLLFCLVCGLVFLFPEELQHLGSDVVATSASAMNIYALKKLDYFAGPAENNPLLMAWSLGVEEQFYILIPLLMQLLAYLTRQRSPGAFRSTVLWLVGLISVLSLALSAVGLIRFRNASFYLLPTRAWELGAGVLMAVYEAGFRDRSSLYGGPQLASLRGVLGIAAVLCAVFFYGPSTPFPGGYALLPVVGTLLTLSARAAWLNRHVLSSAPARAIGLVSYSWYLWHWPLLSFARICSDTPLTLRVTGCLVLLALGIAALSYRYIEQPFRHSQTPQRHLLMRYALGVLAFAAVGLGLRHSGLPSRLPPAAAAFAPPGPGSLTCLAFAHDPGIASSPTCLPARTGQPGLALVGDSHAHAIEPVVGDLAHALGYRFLRLARVQCPPVRGFFDERGDPRQDELCLQQTPAVLALLCNDPSLRVVVLAANWAGPEEWSPEGHGYSGRPGAAVSREQSLQNLRDGLDATVKQLQQAHKTVVLLQDVPAFKFDPVERFRNHLIPARAWLGSHLAPRTEDVANLASPEELFSAQRARAAAVVEQVGLHDQVTIFDQSAHLCSARGCLFSSGGRLLFMDSNHVTVQGAERALQGLRATLVLSTRR